MHSTLVGEGDEPVLGGHFELGANYLGSAGADVCSEPAYSSADFNYVTDQTCELNEPFDQEAATYLAIGSGQPFGDLSDGSSGTQFF